MSDYKLFRGRHPLGRFRASLIVQCWSDGLLTPDDCVAEAGGKGFTDIDTAIHAIKVHAASNRDKSLGDDGVLLIYAEKQIGPYSLPDCIALIEGGIVSKKTLFWRKGMQKWATAELLSNEPSHETNQKPPNKSSFWKELKGCATGIGPAAVTFALVASIVSRCENTKRTEGNVAHQNNNAPQSQQPAPQVGQKEENPNNSTYGMGSGDYELSPVHEIFPSVVIAAANINLQKREVKSGEAPIFPKESNISEIPIYVRNVRKGDRYTVIISPDRFLKRTEEVIEVTEDSPFATLEPQTVFDFPALEKLTQTSSFNLTVSIQKNNETPASRTYTWQAHQINDCPLALTSFTLLRNGEIAYKTKLTPSAIAGYVNENHPWIDGLLKEAKNKAGSISFSGYQQGEQHVMAQIEAIWKALKARGISYSSIGTSTASRYYSFQHVRFVDQTIESTQANCLDGSILLASILRKIGLRASIVVTQDHAYVIVKRTRTNYFDQFDNDPYQANEWFGIETTMLSAYSLEEAANYATNTGRQCFTKLRKKAGHEIAEDGYQIIDIERMRQLNIQPIPYTK